MNTCLLSTTSVTVSAVHREQHVVVRVGLHAAGDRAPACPRASRSASRWPITSLLSDTSMPANLKSVLRLVVEDQVALRLPAGGRLLGLDRGLHLEVDRQRVADVEHADRVAAERRRRHLQLAAGRRAKLPLSAKKPVAGRSSKSADAQHVARAAGDVARLRVVRRAGLVAARRSPAAGPGPARRTARRCAPRRRRCRRHASGRRRRLRQGVQELGQRRLRACGSPCRRPNGANGTR